MDLGNIKFDVNKPIRSKQLSINVNKEGTVREINGKVYVDFLYCGQRVREASGLPWTIENAKLVRSQLDKIILAIKDGSFEFRKVFPRSKKADLFSDLEGRLFGRTRQPGEVLFKDYALEWYDTLKSTARVRERTMLGYRSILRLYLEPFFGELSFGRINAVTLDEFSAWARKQQYRNKPASNATINKCLVRPNNLPSRSENKSAFLLLGKTFLNSKEPSLIASMILSS